MAALIAGFGIWFVTGLVAWLSFVGLGYRFAEHPAPVPVADPVSGRVSVH